MVVEKKDRSDVKKAGLWLMLLTCVCFLSACATENLDIQPEPVDGAPRVHASASALELLKLMNESRRKAGVHPLTLDAELSKIAASHTKSMAKYHYFSHKGRDGKWYSERLKHFGYPATMGAENLARVPNYKIAHQMWLESPEHRENMLNKNYTRVGISHHGNYWAADFASLVPLLGF